MQRFRLEDVQGGVGSPPLMSIMIRESRILRWLELEWRRRRAQKRAIALLARIEAGVSSLSPVERSVRLSANRTSRLRIFLGKMFHFISDFWRLFAGLGLERLVGTAVLLGVILGAWKWVQILLTVDFQTWVILIRNTFWTLLRVFFSLVLSTLWAVPVGIWLGTHPRRLRIAQPIVQVMASFPAPMLYPLVLGVLIYLGVHFDFSSMFLMMLGVQFYTI